MHSSRQQCTRCFVSLGPTSVHSVSVGSVEMRTISIQIQIQRIEIMIIISLFCEYFMKFRCFSYFIETGNWFQHHRNDEFDQFFSRFFRFTIFDGGVLLVRVRKAFEHFGPNDFLSLFRSWSTRFNSEHHIGFFI